MSDVGNQQRKYRELMEAIRQSHRTFKLAWTEARTAALDNLAGKGRKPSWDEVFHANGIAYQSAKPLSEKRDQLLRKLFEDHLAPFYRNFEQGDPDAVDAALDFLEVDVPAFQCGYAKESYLRKLKTVPLTDEHKERLRQYGLHLCRQRSHRREIEKAGQLLIVIANQTFIDQLRAVAASEDKWVQKKAAKMLGVILNGRADLR